MRVCKLTIAAGLVGILGASLASALGLGEIKLNSKLNQPLDAEIKLLQIRDLSKEEILVKLASEEDFERTGVERGYFLTDIKFKVDVGNPGGAVVRLTSRKPVREPFLNFLLETQWPSGRLLREYTVLMDLPVYGDDVVAPIQGAQTTQQPSRSTPSQAPRPAARQPQYPAQSPAQQRPAARDDSRSSPQRYVDVYGPVNAGETMWEIALKVRPDRSVTVQQTMLAMQRMNPGAFIDDNINLLRKGQVLRLPNLDDIYALSAQQAVTEVAQQNQQWNAGRAVGAQLEGSRRVASEPEVEESGTGRVKLTAPGDAEDVASGKGSGAQGRIEALENELAIAMEELDKSTRERDELGSSIGDLEEQIETMERLLDISDQELRALQLASQKSAEQAADTAQTDTAESGDTPVDSTAPVSGEGGDVDVAQTDQQQITEAVQTQGEQPTTSKPPAVESSAQESKVGPKQTARAAPTKKTFLDILKGNILWVGAGVVAIIILGAFFFMRRESQWDGELDDFDSMPEDDLFSEELDENIAVLDNDEDPLGSEEPEFDVAADNVAEEEDSVPVESETADVVGEADIYIAYGKFAQAEDMLLKALETEPDRTDVQVKLLEVYAEHKDLEKFDQQYTQLLTYNDSSANQRAEELRTQFPNAGAFGSHAVKDETPDLDESDTVERPTLKESDAFLSAHEGEDLGQDSDFGELDLNLDMEDLDLDAESLDFDVDDDGDSKADSVEAAPTEELADSGEDDFEFDLDSSEAGTAEDFDLELDLEEEQTDSGDADLLSLGMDTQDSEGDLDLSLDDLEEKPPETDLSSALDDDNEFELDLVPSEQESAKLDGLDNFDDDDEFDLDMGDVDMEALDQEVEELSADLDMDESYQELTEDAAPAPSDSAVDVELSAEDDVFKRALSSVPDTGTSIQRAETDDSLVDENTELDFLADTDESATKLDLARAYIDMGDKEGAKDILDEVAEEGNDTQRQEAGELLSKIG